MFSRSSATDQPHATDVVLVAQRIGYFVMAVLLLGGAGAMQFAAAGSDIARVGGYLFLAGVAVTAVVIGSVFVRRQA